MNQTMTENEVKQVQTLCEEHYNVAVVGDRIYAYTSFDASSVMSGVSVEYCTMRAVDITPFVKLDRISVGRAGYLNEFRRYMDNKTYLNVRFNRTTDYTLFSLT